MKSDCIAAALAELETHGVRDVVVARGSKHPQVRFQINGGPLHVVSLPGTPSDWRAPANTRSDIRKYLREQGVAVDPAKRDALPPPRTPTQLELQSRRITALERHIAELELRLSTLETPKPQQRKPSNGAQLALMALPIGK